MHSVVVEDEQGLLFWPPQQVASFTPSFLRWRVVHSGGMVAHCTQPPPPGPWVPLGPAWVQPSLLRPAPGGGWLDPAHFCHYGELPPSPHETPPEDPLVEGPNLPASQILGVSSAGKGCCTWHTDLGEVAGDEPVARAAARMPERVMVSSRRWLNPARLGRIVRLGAYRIEMDNGLLMATLKPEACRQLVAQLGLPDPDHLQPHVPALWRDGLRDYPEEIAEAPAELLKTWFPNPRRLIANLIFQALRYRQLGIEREYADTHRGFWYEPVASTLYRAGFVVDVRDPSDPLRQLYERILEQLVGDDRLFTYRQFGFKDLGQRHIGDRRPEVLLMLEKESQSDSLEAIRQRFGLSTFISGGAPRLIYTEYLAEDLRALGKPIVLLAFVDYDPAGWANADGLERQLRKAGVPLAGPVQFVLRAQDFTPRELELKAHPCPTQTPHLKTLTRKWVERTGGIGGKALAMYCNVFKPVQRVLDRLEEMLG